MGKHWVGRGARVAAVVLAALAAAVPTYADPVAVPSCRADEIAFVSKRDGDEEIFAMRADGTNVRQLTHNNVYDGDPVWSPDGEWIAFDRVTGVKGPTDEAPPHDIFVVRADGTGERNVTKTPTKHEGTPAWSPDGKRLAFHTNADGDFEIYVVDVDGTHRRDLTNRHAGATGVVSTATGRVAADLKPTWSTDGRIAFESYRDDLGLASDIWVMNDDGSNQRPLVVTPFPADEWYPAWSTDGSHIAYMSSGGDGEPFDVYTALDDGSGVKNVTQTPKTELRPAWSPDGSRVAFASDIADGGVDTRVHGLEWDQSGTPGAADNFEIYTARADGTGLTRVTDSPGLDTGPAYRPRNLPCHDAAGRSSIVRLG